MNIQNNHLTPTHRYLGIGLLLIDLTLFTPSVFVFSILMYKKALNGIILHAVRGLGLVFTPHSWSDYYYTINCVTTILQLICNAGASL